MMCSATIDCSYYFEDQTGKVTPKNKYFMTNLMTSLAINLPDIFQIQSEFGFFLVSSNKNELKTGFMLGFQRQFILPIIKMIDLKVYYKNKYYFLKLKFKLNFSLNNQKNTMGIMLGKSTETGYYSFIN